MTAYTPTRDEAFLGAMCLVMNPQSRGVNVTSLDYTEANYLKTVTIQSSNPSTAPRINPNFLSHPYDRRVLIDGLRQTMKLLSTPIYANTTIELIGPKDDSDAEIWEYIKCNTHSSWHMSCTARMGKDINSACVDSDFRVFGLEALRIVDLSVCPFVPK
ncbi:MAG: hypothetical protein CL912_01730 [Deltaproteobacteria bacterium]|nr:hypothetical protein [Deltaproteobacteria bacterium]